MLKENKGITLVALVITIIVLIILAGVSINILFGNDGIIIKAKEATEDYKRAAENEEGDLENLENIDNYIYGETEEINTEPELISNGKYPVLTTYGIVYEDVNIKFDDNNNINNYYSIDNGETWIEYNGILESPNNIILAKSQIRNSEIQIQKSIELTLESDALPPIVWNSDFKTTYKGNTDGLYMKVSQDMGQKQIFVNWTNGNSSLIYLYFLDENKNVISNVSRGLGNNPSQFIYTVPTGTRWIKYVSSAGYDPWLITIQPTIEFQIIEDGYMLLARNPSERITAPYQMVKINFSQNSIQKLYQIDNTEGEWLNYTEEEVKVEAGHTIYAKEINVFGKETVSQYLATVNDALPAVVCDGNFTTHVGSTAGLYMKVNEDMGGRQILVGWSNGNSSLIYLYFIDENKNVIGNVSRGLGNNPYQYTYNVPTGTRWIKYVSSAGYDPWLREIQVVE